MSPIYVKKLPWKFDIDRLQKELQPLKSLFIPWDPDTKEDFNDSYILGFLHSKDCPPEKRLYDSVRSFCPKRPSVFSSSSGYKYNILKPIIHDGTGFNKRLKRFKVREDYTVFNEDYLATRNEKLPLDIKQLQYIPYTENKSYEIDAGSIEKGKVIVQVFEVSAQYGDILIGLDAENKKYDLQGHLRVGSMSEASLNGNWGE